MKRFLILITFDIISLFSFSQQLIINEDEYFEMPGLNVMVFYDI